MNAHDGMNLNRNHCKILIAVNHVRQNYSWDCGLSSVMMVLQRKEKKMFLENFEAICKEEDLDKRLVKCIEKVHLSYRLFVYKSILLR